MILFCSVSLVLGILVVSDCLLTPTLDFVSVPANLSSAFSLVLTSLPSVVSVKFVNCYLKCFMLSLTALASTILLSAGFLLLSGWTMYLTMMPRLSLILSTHLYLGTFSKIILSSLSSLNISLAYTIPFFPLTLIAYNEGYTSFNTLTAYLPTLYHLLCFNLLN